MGKPRESLEPLSACPFSVRDTTQGPTACGAGLVRNKGVRWPTSRKKRRNPGGFLRGPRGLLSVCLAAGGEWSSERQGMSVFVKPLDLCLYGTALHHYSLNVYPEGVSR